MDLWAVVKLLAAIDLRLERIEQAVSATKEEQRRLDALAQELNVDAGALAEAVDEATPN